MPKTVVTTVTTLAAVRDLTTLATVKDTLSIAGTADDAFLSRAISQCSAAIEQACNRVFALETVQDTVFPGRVSALQLSRWPVVSVISVTEDGEALIAGTGFTTDAAVGRLIRMDTDGTPRPWRAIQVAVTYQAGYVLPGDVSGAARTLPFDIEDATLRLVVARYAERRRDPFIKSEEVAGVGRIDYIVGNPAAGDGNLPPDVADIVRNYRVPVIG